MFASGLIKKCKMYIYNLLYISVNIHCITFFNKPKLPPDRSF